MAIKTRTKGIVAIGGALLALAIATIGGFEGRRTTAYQDVVGVWTICDGLTEGVKKGDKRTPAECDAALEAGIARYERELDRCLTAEVPPRSKVALLSWAWNVGTGAACRSTLVRLANAGQIEDACRQLPRWNRAGGKVVPGLVKRRAAEMSMCLDGLKAATADEPTHGRAGWTWWLWIIAGLATVAGAAWLFYRLRKPKAAT